MLALKVHLNARTVAKAFWFTPAGADRPVT